MIRIIQIVKIFLIYISKRSEKIRSAGISDYFIALLECSIVEGFQ